MNVGMHSSEKRGYKLDEMFQQNASKYAIFLEYENTSSFFHFVLYYLIFECPGLCQQKPEHSLAEKNKVTQNEKQKNLHGFSVFKFQKYGKF